MYTLERTDTSIVFNSREKGLLDAAQALFQLLVRMANIQPDATATAPAVEDSDDDEYAFVPARQGIGPSWPGRRLKGFRRREGLTQRELAARLSVSRQHLADLESGRRGISPPMAKRLGETLGAARTLFFPMPGDVLPKTGSGKKQA